MYACERQCLPLERRLFRKVKFSPIFSISGSSLAISSSSGKALASLSLSRRQRKKKTFRQNHHKPNQICLVHLYQKHKLIHYRLQNMNEIKTKDLKENMSLWITYLNLYFRSAPKQSLAQSMCIHSYQGAFPSIHHKSGGINK